MLIKAFTFVTIIMMAGCAKPSLHNSITSGAVCNQLGTVQYVQNDDSQASYNVTVKVSFFDPGVGNSETQKTVKVDAGGKTPLGCSAGYKAGATYTYSVIGETRN